MAALTRKRVLVAVIVVALAGAASASALLLTSGGSKKAATPGAHRTAATGASRGAAPASRGAALKFLTEVAKRVGVQPAAIDSAVQAVAAERINQALASGALTKEQAAKYRSRVDQGQLGGLIAKLEKLATSRRHARGKRTQRSTSKS